MKELRFILLLVAGIVAGLLILHYARPVSMPSGQQTAAVTEGPAQAAATGPIAKVDFRNFTYQPGCSRDSNHQRAAVATRDGRFELNTDTDKLSFLVVSIAYGDLTGDGQDEAAVLTGCNTGGSGDFSEGIVYGFRDGKAVELARTESGDRAYGGIQKLGMRDGLLVVERFATDEGGPMCCPKYLDTLRYRLTTHGLQAEGAATRQEIPPSS